MEKMGGIGSWHRVLTRKASVRRRAGSWKREFNRDVNRQKMLIEMLPQLCQRLYLARQSIRGFLAGLEQPGLKRLRIRR